MRPHLDMPYPGHEVIPVEIPTGRVRSSSHALAERSAALAGNLGVTARTLALDRCSLLTLLPGEHVGQQADVPAKELDTKTTKVPIPKDDLIRSWITIISIFYIFGGAGEI